MATATIKLGPADHGRRMTREEYEAATGEEGYWYELIHGRVYVSPVPNMPHAGAQDWLYFLLRVYARQHREVITFVSTSSRVFVTDSDEDATIPEPDLAVFDDVPLGADLNSLRWEDYSPFLVVEVLSPDGADKDLNRNVDLYQQVPSIKEYWVLDPLRDANRPDLRVYRRRGRRWQKPIDVPGGGTYTTKLLPDFELVLDVRL